MLSISLAQLKIDIASKMKGTSIREIKDFYGTAAAAANRMVSRIDTQETRRIVTLSTPFYDNVHTYSLPTDYKGMIDIKPQANLRQEMPGLSDFSQTTPRQFSERLSWNSFSIGWNNMIRTLKAQRLPQGNVATMDTFENASANGLWTGEGDASGLYTEPLNYVQGNSSLGFNLSGATGLADLLNTTAAVTDLSALRYQDASMLFFYIPLGFSSRFTSFTLRRGSSALNYKQATVITRADGTAFTDGWNFLLFQWNTASTTGTPDDTKNTYRRFGVNYTTGAIIPSCLIDSWTDSLGSLYEIEYYSEYMFRTSAGVWIAAPTLDTDLVNVGPNSYEILKTEMMVDITQQIRTGAVMDQQLTEWRLQLNGQSEGRYIKDPPMHGLYRDYLSKFPSSQIITATNTYEFDV